MQLIRTGVFETNSSSTHSITLGPQTQVLRGLTPDQFGYVKIHPIEFGWEYETYAEPASKLAYLWVYAKDWSKELADTHMAALKDMVFDHTGGELVMVEDAADYYPYGYIDHQSVEEEQLHELFADREQLRRFAFGAESVLETGNDNY